jgi:hypothetical protein
MRTPFLAGIAALLLTFAVLAQSPPSSQQPSRAEPRVQSFDTEDEEEEDDDTPWMLYGAIGGFVLFGAVVYLVISRAARSAKE